MTLTLMATFPSTSNLALKLSIKWLLLKLLCLVSRLMTYRRECLGTGILSGSFLVIHLSPRSTRRPSLGGS
jgi:hypothetical protein